MEVIIISTIILGLLGLIFGAGLYIASRKFAVEIDPRVERVTELLPGANCGGCGNPGCSGLAEKMVRGEAEVNDCPVCGLDAKKLIAEVLGKAVTESSPKVAVIRCQKETIEPRYDYDGIKDCRAAATLNGGFTTCQYGCLGLGNCAAACKFEALYMGTDGMPHVVEEKCVACGACVKACPRGIIVIAPLASDVNVLCNSRHNGKYTKDCCSHGCIGCKICEKKCPTAAIKVENFLASIDYDKCIVCGACVGACPTGAIGDLSLLRGKGKTAAQRYEPAPAAAE